jgi:hypothetical protein
MVLNEPQTNIEGLSLRYMKLSDEACAALAEAIKVNWTLARFELHGTFLPCHYWRQRSASMLHDSVSRVLMSDFCCCT